VNCCICSLICGEVNIEIDGQDRDVDTWTRDRFATFRKVKGWVVRLDKNLGYIGLEIGGLETRAPIPNVACSSPNVDRNNVPQRAAVLRNRLRQRPMCSRLRMSETRADSRR
jgi:hypothetical protein